MVYCQNLLLEVIINMSYVLGRGSYGTIVHDPNSKTCRKLFSKDKGYSFLREAYIIKSLSHIPGITNIINIGHSTEQDKEICPSAHYSITMKRYDITLRDWLKTNIGYQERMKILREIVGIIYNVHSCGVIHGDLRLENIMLSDERAIIIDWGLSGPDGYARTNLTSNIYKSKKTYNSYCDDIYALGIISLELIIGSVFVDVPHHESCLRLISSTSLPRKFKELLGNMISPSRKKRPTINIIREFFHIPSVNHNIIDFQKLYPLHVLDAIYFYKNPVKDIL